MQSLPEVLRFIAGAGMSALTGKRALNCLWELTYRCTAKCEICDYWKSPSKPQDELKLPDIQKGLEKIYAHGCRAVNFTGGEPTIRKDLENIIHYASKLGMWTSIVTNGSLMTRDRMKDLKKAGLDNLFVSLDSINANSHNKQRGMNNSYQQVINCMQWLGQDFLTWHHSGGIMCVLSSMNIDQVEEIIQLADKFGVYVVFQTYHHNKTGNFDFVPPISDEQVDNLLRLKRQYKNVLCSGHYLKEFSRHSHGNTNNHCNAGRKYFSIDPYGNLHPCVDMPAVGHLLKDDMSVIQSDEALKHVGSCQGCWYCFRGEADSMLSYQGCWEKLCMGLTTIMRNEGRRKDQWINQLNQLFWDKFVSN